MGKLLLRLAGAAVAIGIVAAGVFAYRQRSAPDDRLTLYGNIEFRQAWLPFNGTERIADILVEEGDRVDAGDLLARLETGRLEPRVAEVEAVVAAQQAVLDRLLHGTRPEEIAQARANLAAARAVAASAQQQYQRRQRLARGRAASEEELEVARAAAEETEAAVTVNQRQLELAIAGPRKEEIDEAQAQLRRSEAQLALVRQQLRDAELLAPFDGVVRSRLMEPGEMASPTRPVITLAMTGTKWVRAYVNEPDLGRIRPGMQARVFADGFPGEPFAGWIGFISPVAEFTPRTVQTEDLRTSLVYEVRVFVEDPENRLRLGMPVTVRLPPADGQP